MKEILIKTEYITLGQFLKIADLIATGGEAKFFLNSPIDVLINGEIDKRRGRKLRDNDVVKINNREFIIKQKNGN